MFIHSFLTLFIYLSTDGYNLSKNYIPFSSFIQKSFLYAQKKYILKFIRRRSVNPIRKNRCELKLVADYEFFRVIGNSNYANAARYLVCYLLFKKVTLLLEIKNTLQNYKLK